jgi:Protein of unknown function (DUF1549)/Protein of unknown function (DUF1553)
MILVGRNPGPMAWTILPLILACCEPAVGADPPKAGRATENAVSFRNEVMAVLGKAGCNAGTCHGNKNGKGGFKLSLRGQDPEADYLALTRDAFARRVNPVEPERSMILLKPTARIAHEGGLRFTRGAPEYEILRRWILAGLPNDLESAPRLERIEVDPAEKVLVEPERTLPLRVRAFFSNGAVRDVTTLAVYETPPEAAKISHDGLVQGQGSGEATVLVRYLQAQEPVRLAFVPARPGFQWKETPVQNEIDDRIFAKLRKLRMNPSDLCSDRVFVRRAYLDLLGILPTAEEAQAFLSGTSGDAPGESKASSPSASLGTETGLPLSASAETETMARRARLIDRLLERPEFADFWALKWADLLRVEAHSLDQKGVQNFHHWIRQSVAENKPLDQFVRELIAARGSTYTHPAANYYRPNRDPASRAKAVAQIFLGTRLQCAQCHNHPFDRWTQDDYYDWAGLFARVNYKVIENHREIGSDEHEWKGEQVVFMDRTGSVRNPRTGRDARPRFLGAVQTRLEAGQDPLEALADWLTGPNNSIFAPVQANRIWSQLMGRGLVDPPDDFRATNPASHPALLEALGRDLAAHHYDARYLIRLIMTSRTYQLSSTPNETNAGDEVNFSHALVRRLEAEPLLDCESQVTEVPLNFAGYPPGLRAAQLPGVRPESKGQRRAHPLDLFLETFGKPPRLLSTDTERSCECNMGQAFQMISGSTLNHWLSAKENRISRLLAAGKTNRDMLLELFWTALTRPPTAEEQARLLSGLESAPDRRAEWEDILWGLLNSKEFLFRP